MSSFENWLRILSMESIHFFERETATVKKHFQKTCQFLFSVQNLSTLHRKRLEIASKIEKLDFYKLVKKCWQFHNSRHFTKSTTWVKTKPVFVVTYFDHLFIFNGSKFMKFTKFTKLFKFTKFANFDVKDFNFRAKRQYLRKQIFLSR